MVGTEWQVVAPGQSVGMRQGYALNTLIAKYHPSKVEMGWVNETQGYKLTLPNGRQAIYADEGDVLELVGTVELA